MDQLVKNPPAIQETLVQILGWEDPLEKDRLPTPVFLGTPSSSAGKESACNAGDLGSIPGCKQSTCNVGDLGLIPGIGRIPWKREWLPTLVFWFLAWRIPWPV